MSNLRVAVIGVGHLGRIHARLLQQNSRDQTWSRCPTDTVEQTSRDQTWSRCTFDGVELVAVVDPSEEARTAVGTELNVPAFADHSPLVGQIDAAIIATPSRLHHGVAIVRPLLAGEMAPAFWLHVGVLVAYAVGGFYLATILTRRRLLK